MMTAGESRPVPETGPLEYRPATSADSARWDSFVDSHDSGRLGHLFAYGTVLERAYGFPAVRYVATTRDAAGREEIRGVIMASVTRWPLARRRLVSMPFHEYGGPLVGDAAAVNGLIPALLAEANPRGIRELHLRGMDEPPADSAIQSKEFIRVPLTSEEQLYNEVFPSPLRRSLAKAARSSVAVERIAGWSRIEREFFPLYKAGLKRIGGLPHELRFFRETFELLQPRVQFWVASRKGVPLVAMTAYVVGSSIHVVDLVRAEDGDEFGAGDAIHWEIMRAAIAGGLRTFDFGPAGSAGTRRYKLKWGGRVHYRHDVTLRLPPGRSRAAVSGESVSRALLPGVRPVLRSVTHSVKRSGAAVFRRLPDTLWLALGSHVRAWIAR